MLISLKLFALAAIFIITGGVMFSNTFRKYKYLVACAGIISVIGSYYLFENLYADLKISITKDINISISKDVNISENDVSIEEILIKIDKIGYKISPDGYGLVQIGMTIGDAYRALGIRQFEVDDLSGHSVNFSTCFTVAPIKKKLGLDFMVENGKITRIDVHSDSITTASGLGIGSTDQDLRRIYGESIIIRGHKYVENGKYYIVRKKYTENEILFEVIDGKVSQYRVGAPSSVELVERCL